MRKAVKRSDGVSGKPAQSIVLFLKAGNRKEHEDTNPLHVRGSPYKMAVQQNKKSPSRRGMHRSHDALSNPPIANEPTTGELHLRHHISPNGIYRGRKVLKTKNDE